MQPEDRKFRDPALFAIRYVRHNLFLAHARLRCVQQNVKTKAHLTTRCCSLCLVLLLAPVLLLAGCTAAPKWGGWSKQPSPKQIAAVMGPQPATFLYYPRYEVYQNEKTGEYVYQDGQWWINDRRPPQGIAVATLQETPSVLITLQDSPKREHAGVKQTYPANWDGKSAVVAGAP